MYAIRSYYDRALRRQPCVPLFEERGDEIVANARVPLVLSARAKNQRLVARDIPILKERVVEHRVSVSAARNQGKTLLFAEARKLTLNLNRSVAAIERRTVLVDIVKVHIAFPRSAKGIGVRLRLRPEIQQIPVRRITSYNVCYTKLLRKEGQDRQAEDMMADNGWQKVGSQNRLCYEIVIRTSSIS